MLIKKDAPMEKKELDVFGTDVADKCEVICMDDALQKADALQKLCRSVYDGVRDSLVAEFGGEYVEHACPEEEGDEPSVSSAMEALLHSMGVSSKLMGAMAEWLRRLSEGPAEEGSSDLNKMQADNPGVLMKQCAEVCMESARNLFERARIFVDTYHGPPLPPLEEEVPNTHQVYPLVFCTLKNAFAIVQKAEDMINLP